MHLYPLTSLSGKTQWSIRCSSPDIEESTVRISISLHGFADGQDALKIVGDQMANAEFDWMYVYNGRIRIDADVARDDLGNWGKRILWFRGLLEIEPDIRQGEIGTSVELAIHKDSIRSMTVSGGGFAVSRDSSFFRRVVTWLPLSIALAWSVLSFFWEGKGIRQDGFFSYSGALVAVAGGWVDIWVWLWRRDSTRQPIQPSELATSTVLGYVFVAIGSVIWAYGHYLV